MLAALVWLLGLHMGVQSLAAVLLPLDLGAAGHKFSIRMGARVASWWLVTVSLWVLLPTSLHTPYGIGLATSLVGFVGWFALLRFIAPQVWRRNNVR